MKIKPGIYSYKGKEYYAYGTLARGTGTDHGRVFVAYTALYPCPEGREFIREYEDFKSKFTLEGPFVV